MSQLPSESAADSSLRFLRPTELAAVMSPQLAPISPNTEASASKR